MWSSSQAKAIFDEGFAAPARAHLADVGSVPPQAAYTVLGKLWATTRRRLEKLGGEHAHRPAEDRTIENDVEDAVLQQLDALVAELDPHHSGGVKLQRRWSEVRKHMEIAYKMALAGEAADRAAAVTHARPPSLPIDTPAKPQSAAAAHAEELAEQAIAEMASKHMEQFGPDSELVNSLRGRMYGTDGGAVNQQQANPGSSGNGLAVERQRAGSIMPGLGAAAARLVNPGPPRLRVECKGQEIWDNMLRENETIVRWVDAQRLTGHSDREARTIARSVELAVKQFGVAYLASAAAEVQGRRLLAICLASKQGTWEFAELLEELPGTHATSCLPRSLLKEMGEDFKAAQKISQGLEKK